MVDDVGASTAGTLVLVDGARVLGTVEASGAVVVVDGFFVVVVDGFFVVGVGGFVVVGAGAEVGGAAVVAVVVGAPVVVGGSTAPAEGPVAIVSAIVSAIMTATMPAMKGARIWDRMVLTALASRADATPNCPWGSENTIADVADRNTSPGPTPTFAR